MSTAAMAALINRTGSITIPSRQIDDMSVFVRIIDVANQYGNVRVLVEPIAGTGKTWMNLTSVKLDGEQWEQKG